MSTGTENRRDTRRVVFPGEGIKVKVKDIEEKRSFHGEITDLSPWGVNILIINQQLATYPKKADSIKIFYITKDNQTSFVYGRVVYILEKVIDEVNYLRYGVEFISGNENSSQTPPEKKKIYEIPDIFGSHCWCEDPFFFQEKILFKIKNFHANGMTLITSARNKTLFPNLKTQIKITIPTSEEFLIDVKILKIEISSKSNENTRYHVEVQFESVNTRFLQIMVEYILFCGVEVTPKELRDDNFPVEIIENSLSYFYAIEANEIEKVLLLRQNSLFQKTPNSSDNNNSLNSYKDEFDTFARQLVCKVGKRPVACIRIIFNNKNKKKCELNNYIDTIPESIWSKNFVEISKFSWEKDFRESDIFINMIRQIVRIVIQSNHTHILTSVPESLKSLFTKVGFQPLQLSWNENIRDEKKLETILMLDVKGIISGEIIIDKFIWNKVYYKIFKHLGLIKN
ncbi:hypothetical protein [Spirobacillus cienkowskii]|uniref:hypothetical protein n=1 Tax=Spirobacillus cienkowskii TaxID=495820 RepID=UPI0030D1CE71